MSVSFKHKPLSEQVIVITGASSGIGLATAKMAAKKGARVVLAARNEEALQDICDEIAEAGGEAAYAVADVAEKAEVEKIARTAIRRFGGIDTWVNDAGVGTLGRLDEVPDDDHRRVFDTNFWGVVNGSLVAADKLKSGGGTIINIGSELSDASIALQGMYCASKHAVKGFTNSLRMELEEAGLPVRISLIKPAAIATPFFEHTKNYTGHEFRAPAPVYAPEEVARAILHCATHDTRELYVGSASKMMAGLQAHLPRLYDWLNEKTSTKSMPGDENAPQAHNDNLHQPGDDGRVNGRNPGAEKGRASVYTRATMHPVATVLTLAGVGLAALAVWRGGPVRKAATAAFATMPALNIHPRVDRYMARVKKLAA